MNIVNLIIMMYYMKEKQTKCNINEKLQINYSLLT